MAKQLNVNLAVRADTGQAKAQIQELQAILNKIMHTGSTTTLKGIDATKIKQAASAAKELQMHLNNAFNVNTGKFDLSQLDKSLKASGSNITDLSTKLLNAGSIGQQAFMKLAQSISLADQPMLRINNKLNEFATTLKNTARWQLSSSMLHGFMGAVQSAYGYAQDLNESLTNIRIVTGQNAEQMAEFAESANKAAKTLSTTTTDYTNASLIYYQQGLTDEQVIERTNVTIKMANAAGESAQTVSDQMTAVWNNFAKGGENLEYYADVMTALGAATASSTSEISEGLEKFASVAETVGLSYEYATSALATVTATTRQSADIVGTAFKTLFARIQDLELGKTLDDGTTLGQYSKALESVGVNIKDANGEIKDMDTILEEMAAKWQTLAKDQQVSLAQSVAGVRQYTQLIALMDNWDFMQENLDTAYNSAGTLTEQAEIYAESWEAASKRVKASAEGLYQSLLDDDFFIDINNGFANMLTGLDAFIDGAGGLKTVIVGISSIIVSNFANKIPEAIQTAKYNIDVLTKGSTQAYQNIQKDMQAATETMFAKQGIDKNSSLGFMVESSNELAAARTKLAAISDRMSSSERQMAETELSLAQSIQEETYALYQKAEALKAATDLSSMEMKDDATNATLENSLAKMREFGEVAKESLQAFDGTKVLQVKEPLAQLDEAAGNLSQKLNNELITALEKIGTGTKIDELKINVSALGRDFDILKNTVDNIELNVDKDDDITNVKNALLDLIHTFPEGVKESKALKSAIKDIGDAEGGAQLKIAFENFKKQLQDCTLNGNELIKALKKMQDPSDVDKWIVKLKEMSSTSNRAKQENERLKESLKDFNPQHIVRTSEALGSLAGMMGNVVTIGNGIKSIFKSWSNPDLSSWEKLSATFMGLSMMIPSTLSLMKSYGIVLSYVNGLTAANGMVTATATVAQKAEAAAVGMSATRHRILSQVLTEEQIKKALSIAITAKEAGQTKEAIAAKVLEYLTTQKIVSGKTAETIARNLAKVAIDAETVSVWALVKALLASAAAWVATNPLIAAAGVLLAGVAVALINISQAEEKANETMSESIFKWKEAKGELESLNSELETTKDRIAELEAMDSLSIVEQEELDKLYETEASLERQIALQEQLVKADQTKAANDFEDNYKTLSKFTKEDDPTKRTVQVMGKKTSEYTGDKGSAITAEKYKELYIDSLLKEDGTLKNERKRETYEERVKYYEQWLANEDAARAQWLADNQESLTNMEEGYLAWLEQNLNAKPEEKAEYAQGIQDAYKKGLGEEKYAELVESQTKNERVDEESRLNKSFDEIIAEQLENTGDDVEASASNLAGMFSEEFKNQLYTLGIVPEDYAQDLIEKAIEFEETINNALSEAGSKLTLEQIKKDNRWSEEDLEILTQIKLEGDDDLNSIFEKIEQHKSNELAVNFNASTWGKETAQKQAVVEDLEIGDTISPDDFAILGDAYKEYFELQNDGTYRLIASAEDLKAAIDAIESKKALENIKAESENINKVENSTMNTVSAQELWNEQNQLEAGDRSAAAMQRLESYKAKVEEVYGIECESIQEAIDIMVQHNEQLSATQGALFNSANSLYELQAMRGQVLEETGSVDYGQYAEALMNLGSQYDNCSQEVEKYKQALIGLSDEMASSDAATRASAEEYIKQAEDVLNASILIGEASEKYGFDAEVVERQAKQYQKLHPEMELTAEQAAQLAINNQRMNKGMKTLNNNFADWKKVLKSADKTTMDYADAVVNCTDAIADLVGASDDLELPDEFFNDENMKLIEKAMKGDIKAVNQLGAAVAGATVDAMEFNDAFADMINELESWNGETPDIKLSHEQFDSDKAIVLQGIQDIQNGVISAGAAMDGEWVAALNRMALTTGMSVEQMNGLLGSLGVQAKVETTYVPQKMQVPTYIEKAEPTTYTEYETHSTGNEGETKQVPVTRIGWRKYTIPSEPVTVEGYAAVAQISTEDNPLTAKVTSNTAKGGGSPAASYSGHRGSASPSSTKGKSGGGGGSKAKSEKVDKTKKSDVVERYKEINDQIDNMSDKLEDATTEADRLYGRNRINKMKEVSNTLQQEIKLLEKKTSEAKEYLKIDKKALQEGAKEVGVNFSFDAADNISNYESQMEALYNRLAAAEKKADPSNFKTKEAQDEFIEKHVTPLKDQIDALEELVNQYDETRELIEDLDNEARDKFNEWQDNNFEILNYELELKLEVDDAELRKLEYLLSKIEDDFYSLAEAGALMIGKENGDELDTTNSQLEIYENRLKDLKVQRDALTNSYKNGEISQSQFVEGLQELEDLAYDNAEAIQDLDNTMLHYYGDTLEAAADELSKYTDLMEQHVEVLEHYSNIMDIIGKSTDYEAMGVILEGQAEAAENMVEVSKANYEMLEAQRQARKTEYEAAIGNATDEELAVLKQKWLDAETAANDAQDRMMEDIETWAESLKAVLENKLAGFAQALENVLTGDFGSFDAMTAAMDRANSLQEEYLTTTNKIYETNKLINKAQQEIDKTTNIAAKKRLQAYIQETEQLQNQSELSKYELEIQQAKYDLVLAEIALEEAQNAKSTVRLQRDSEGNFSYVYTADQNKLAEAEQNLADAQNRLYNIGLEGANEYASKYQQTLAEMYDTLADLQEQYLNGAFETEAEYQRAVEEAKEYYYNKLTQYSNLYQVALTTDSAVVADAWSTDFNSMIYKTEEWSSAVDEYLNEVKITFAEWEEQISRIKNETVGQDLDDLKEKVGSITSASDELANSITKDGGVLDGIRDEIEEVNKLTDAYAKARAAIKGTQNAHETFITELRNNIENPDQVVKNKPKEEKKNDPPKNIDNSNNNNNSIDYGKIKAGSKVQVKSGARWHYDSEGTSPTGPAQDGTIKYINLNGSHPYNIDGLGWIKKSDIEKVDKYNTGGYTGSWSGPFGKFAMLHQKELVLNQEDTKNFLTSMEVLERILEMIDLQTLNAQIGGSLLSPTYSNFTKEMLEQSVQIEASFPNVVNRYEIEEAFDTLVNRASQYANRKNF